MTTLENLKEKYILEADEYSQALKQIQSKEPNEELIFLFCSHYKNLDDLEIDKDFEKILSGICSKHFNKDGIDFVVELEVALGDESMKLIKNNLADKHVDKSVTL